MLINSHHNSYIVSPNQRLVRLEIGAKLLLIGVLPTWKEWESVKTKEWDEINGLEHEGRCWEYWKTELLQLIEVALDKQKARAKMEICQSKCLQREWAVPTWGTAQRETVSLGEKCLKKHLILFCLSFLVHIAFCLGAAYLSGWVM